MQSRKRDPLLAIARFFLMAAMAVMVLAGAAMVVALPATLIFSDTVVVRLSGQDAPPEAIWAIVAVLFLIAVMVVLGFYFFRHLYRIVGTVGEGDPFVPVNARRLRAMGWITVAVHVLGIPMAAITRQVEMATGTIRIDADIPLSGLLLAIVLFVLARVFREGTRMREELEGTV